MDNISPRSPYGSFHEVGGVLFVGGLVVRALLLGVHYQGPEFWKLAFALSLVGGFCWLCLEAGLLHIVRKSTCFLSAIHFHVFLWCYKGRAVPCEIFQNVVVSWYQPHMQIT